MRKLFAAIAVLSSNPSDAQCLIHNGLHQRSAVALRISSSSDRVAAAASGGPDQDADGFR